MWVSVWRSTGISSTLDHTGAKLGTHQWLMIAIYHPSFCSAVRTAAHCTYRAAQGRFNVSFPLLRLTKMWEWERVACICASETRRCVCVCALSCLDSHKNRPPPGFEHDMITRASVQWRQSDPGLQAGHPVLQSKRPSPLSTICCHDN